MVCDVSRSLRITSKWSISWYHVAGPIPTARVIFTVSLDMFSFTLEHVWACAVLGDCEN